MVAASELSVNDGAMQFTLMLEIYIQRIMLL
jgi:hypothetical protein